MRNTVDVAAPSEFSLTLGGPLYQLLLRAGILRPPLDLLTRRVLVITALAWVPLLVLAAIQGDLLAGAVPVPFVKDIEVHTRFLIALPLLIVSEVIVHGRLGLVVEQFLLRGIVRPDDRPRFDAIEASTMRWRNSIAMEVALIVLVWTVGHYLWREQLALVVDTWYARVVAGAKVLTPAGRWFAFVSVPVFQFMLLRWYYRLFLWARALWLVSRLDLHLVATHPDRCGGLGFLGTGSYAFSTLLFAQGVLLSGAIASRIFFEGQVLTAFKLEIAGLVVLLVLVVLGPLFVFTPRLLATKRQGLRDYGLLATSYTRDFEQKWIRGTAPPAEPLVGSADIQSLADLANSFDVVRGMRPVPFGTDALLQLGLATALPVAPLVLTMIPFEELVTRLLQTLL